MSSHHFVKEDQEPALYIQDPEAIPFEKIQELLEWSPLVIVSHSALEKVKQWGIKIDVLLTSNKSDEHSQVAIDQSPLQIIYSNKNTSELNSICEFLVNRKQSNINAIVNVAQNYFAEAVENFNKVNIVFFDTNGRWRYVSTHAYSKWLPSQATVQSFINNEVKNHIMNTSGIFKIERNEPFWVGEEY